MALRNFPVLMLEVADVEKKAYATYTGGGSNLYMRSFPKPTASRVCGSLLTNLGLVDDGVLRRTASIVTVYRTTTSCTGTAYAHHDILVSWPLLPPAFSSGRAEQKPLARCEKNPIRSHGECWAWILPAAGYHIHYSVTTAQYRIGS
jgi:hypothetical protein